jgi:hypothetical protein
MDESNGAMDVRGCSACGATLDEKALLRGFDRLHGSPRKLRDTLLRSMRKRCHVSARDNSGAGWAAARLIGRPQLGQAVAAVETSRPQPSKLMIAMPNDDAKPGKLEFTTDVRRPVIPNGRLSFEATEHDRTALPISRGRQQN